MSDPTPTAPTAEEQQKATEVSRAMIDAAAAEPEAAQRQDAMVKAGAKEAEKQNLPLTEDDLKKLATMLGPIVSDGVIDRMDARGMFEPPPEPVQAAPHAEPAPTSAGEPAPPSEPQAPRKRSFAERFFGE